MIHLPRYHFLRQERLGQEGQLIPLLQRAQQVDGYLRRERLLEIHRQTGVPLASIYGVATFYAQFRLSPVGKHLIRVCHGTACHVAGANDITDAIEKHLQINTGDTTPDRLFTLETVSCLGCCSLAPVIMIDNATHGNLTDRKVIKVLKQYQQAAATPTEVAP
ncbi:MAG TPA: NADH-quinone oxidoreductase subunit NuoE [Polyangiaceae bacterium]|nr:NADH-quinone oxidoreductase subunit NuoE [Polyangiaceae bacterium]